MHRWLDDTAAAIRRIPRRDKVFAALVVVAGAVSPWLVTSNTVVAVLATAASAALVLARHRRPEFAFLGSALVYAAWSLGGLVGVVITAVSAGRRVRPAGRLLLVTASAIVATTALNVLLDSSAESMGPLVMLQGAVSVMLLGLPALAGALLGGRRPLTRLLRERNEYLERATMLTAANARAQERTRIAGEMHDLLGHRLSLISVHAGALEYGTATSAPQISAQAELLRTAAHTALDELRQILVVLGVPDDGDAEDVDLTGTRADVTALVEHSREAGIEARLEWTGDDLSGVDVRTRRAVHRAVREGLTNVHRHAVTADTAVVVDAGQDRIQVAVTNGPARTPGKLLGTGRGLAGLSERAALVGGTVTAAPEAGGFALRLDVPRNPPAVPELPAPDYIGVGVEPPPLSNANVLTLPRILGIGCVGLLVGTVLVTAIGGLVVLLTVK
ncbi:sensor histidine kinase [Amycolatopsis sp.]|uniref:sensor histidine kinase n=1 Tax=Amycolatopsis sp. TaxID=37632 RepID=UPI002E08DFA8|nr:histidine kinase [Amycolatopsis sp.]